MNHELILVLDFGGQYNQLIARRVRNLNVYCEVIPFNTPLDEIIKKNPKGIIFTGGPNVVSQEDSPTVDKKIFDIGIPILGICYGCQLMAYLNGGEIGKAEPREYGKTSLFVKNEIPLFYGFNKESICWMSHTYYITKVPNNFEIIAETKNCFSAAIFNPNKNLYGVQFHPEVIHTEFGNTLIKNFLYEICKCSGDWTIKNIAKELIENIKDKVKDKKALCALSGGVDSSVAAILVHKAIGKNLTCVFVDHGLLRLNEGDEVENTFKNFDINLIRVNAESRFLKKLDNVTSSEEKRKIIGEEFIRVFEEESKKIGIIDYLIQGTIYSDVIESGTHSSATIKSHHNVGGLPEVIDFEEIIEPLRNLFKDEVRELGYELGLPASLIERQPFPGPGLAIRIMGAVTKEKLDILRKTDFIFRDEIAKADMDREIWQYFTVLTNTKSVGVMGDERTYEYVIALRAVTSIDAMTADWVKIPYNILEKISIRLINEVNGINRVVYDITSKPPATIEWE